MAFFRIRSNATVGSETLISLSNAAVAYDSNLLKSKGLTSTQGGRLIIGSHPNADESLSSQEAFSFPKIFLPSQEQNKEFLLSQNNTRNLAGMILMFHILPKT